MKVLIRTDASTRIGSGHVMRCLTLAEKLREEGAWVTFVCRELEGHLGEHIRQSRFELVSLPWDDSLSGGINRNDLYATWLGVPMATEIEQCQTVFQDSSHYDLVIVDHYALGQEWERTIRPHTNSIMAIDDLANRSHDCDILLDQNLYQGMAGRYCDFVSPDTKLLLGPQYALLRGEFQSVSNSRLKRDGKVERLLVFFGGIDPTNETSKAIEAIKILPEVKTDIVIGKNNPNRAAIEQLIGKSPKMTLHCQINNMAEMMARSDLVVGGGGTATWERCWLGLPSVVWSIADNQVAMSVAVADRGGAIYLGDYHEVTADQVGQTLQALMNDPERLRSIGQKAFDIMGARTESGCEKVVKMIRELEYAGAK